MLSARAPGALAIASVRVVLLGAAAAFLTSHTASADSAHTARRAADTVNAGNPSGTAPSSPGTAPPRANAAPVREPSAGAQGPPRAPSGPPLTPAAQPAGGGGGEVEAAGGVGSGGELDPLVSNGLGSPTCARLGAVELGAAERRNCETSGFIAAPAPTGDYGIDVHIDTGVLGLSSGTLLSAVQDVFVTPVWLALVWGTHALIVMLEWSFTLDLLPGSGVVGLGGALQAMDANLTQPWLALVLACAAVLAAYQGIARRRVAETLGESLAMLAMIAAGLWVIADPGGTVGALGQLAGRAALGTFAVAARGTPERPAGSFAATMDLVFSAAVEAPWCYLEFGDVGWCRDPVRLDGRLRAAGLRIADAEKVAAACDRGTGLPSAVCGPPSGAPPATLEHSEQLLREARTNGAIFLALPPNGPSRNAINEAGSLLRTLCQSSMIGSCRGPTAAVAEFRGNGATWSRIGGLLLIAIGLLGMLLLLGFLTLRLLAAAILSLMYLLLAPAIVLAPAFGERGRQLFGRWATQLFAAIVAKLLFSFLLGVVVAVLGVLATLTAIGWWTQWLLMSALWWGAFMRRHQAIQLTGGALRGELRPGRRSFGRTARAILDPSVAAARALKRRRERDERTSERSQADRAEPTTDAGVPRSEQPGPRSGPPATQPAVDPASLRPGGRPDGSGTELGRDGPEGEGQGRDGQGRDGGRSSALRDQLLRVVGARRVAEAAGDRRRVAELDHRAGRVESELAQDEAAQGGSAPRARRVAASQAGNAVLPTRPSGASADASRVAGDSEPFSPSAASAPIGPAQPRDRAQSRAHPAGHERHAPRAERSTAAREQLDRELSDRHGGQESSVMWDVREVAAGRKRQLGEGRE